MRTSERLGHIADGLQAQLSELRRLAIDLPPGATLEMVEHTEAVMRERLKRFRHEAFVLRRGND